MKTQDGGLAGKTRPAASMLSEAGKLRHHGRWSHAATRRPIDPRAGALPGVGGGSMTYEHLPLCGAVSQHEEENSGSLSWKLWGDRHSSRYVGIMHCRSIRWPRAGNVVYEWCRNCGQRWGRIKMYAQANRGEWSSRRSMNGERPRPGTSSGVDRMGGADPALSEAPAYTRAIFTPGVDLQKKNQIPGGICGMFKGQGNVPLVRHGVGG